MPPITWRNVEAPSFRDAILAGAQAQQSFNYGFDSLNKLIDQESKTNIANWDNTAKNNTEKFYADVASQFKTPEEYQAALKSGLVDQMRQQYGAQIDQAGARKYLEERPGILMDRLTKEQTYTDAQTELRQRDYINGFKQAIAAASTPEELATLRQGQNTYGSLGHINPVAAASLVDQAVNRGRTLVSDTQAAEKLKSDITHQRAMEKSSLISALANQTQASAALEANKLRKAAVDAAGKASQQADAVAAREAVLAQGPLGAGTLNTPEGKKNLVAALKDQYRLPDNAINDILENVNALYSDGTFKLPRTGADKKPVKDEKGMTIMDTYPVPVSAILSLAGSNPDWFGDGSFWSRRGDTVRRQLPTKLRDSKFLEEFLPAYKLMLEGDLRAVYGRDGVIPSKESRVKGGKPPNTPQTISNPLAND